MSIGELLGEEVRAERAGRVEAKRLAQAYRDFDDVGMERGSRSVVVFDVDPFHTYAALWVGGRWFVTGREAPNGAATEDLLAWLIQRGVTARDLVWLS